MNCLDCLGDHDGYWPLGKSHPAVAICWRCGAGLCDRHAVVDNDVLTVTAPIGRSMPIDPPARRIRCRQCASAEDAQRQTSSMYEA